MLITLENAEFIRRRGHESELNFVALQVHASLLLHVRAVVSPQLYLVLRPRAVCGTVVIDILEGYGRY